MKFARETGQVITAAQCRAGRALLQWTQQHLSRTADVGLNTIVSFEIELRQPRLPNLLAIAGALEAGGVDFIPESGGGPGVRLRRQRAPKSSAGLGVPTLYTARLILRPLDLSDAAPVQTLFPRWEIVRFLSDRIPWPYPPDGAHGFIRDQALPAMANGTEWHWSIRPRAAPEGLIGLISLMDTLDDNRGFWLAPEWQGQGLMTEASTAVTDYWFETLGKHVLRVPKAAANLPARRISERAGMRVIATAERDFVSGRQPAEIWEITREEWRAFRSGSIAATR